MKKRLTGLFAILIGTACACVATIVDTEKTTKIVLWVIFAVFLICGAVMLKHESERTDS